MVDLIEVVRLVQVLEEEIAQKQKKVDVLREALSQTGIVVTKVKAPVINPVKEEAIKLWRTGEYKRVDIQKKLNLSRKTVYTYLKEEK